MKMIFPVVVACLALSGPAGLGEARAAQQPKSDGAHSTPRPPSRWWTSEVYRQELRLTTEQSADIDRIVQSSMARLKGDKEDLDRAQSEFRQLMMRPDVGERDLLKAAERLEMARYSMSKERTTMLVRIHSVLTPEQRRGLDAIAKRNDSGRDRPR